MMHVYSPGHEQYPFATMLGETHEGVHHSNNPPFQQLFHLIR